MIHGLALCAGAGGLELGLRLALGDAYRTVGYVERDAYTAALLVARMADQALGRAPFWDELQTFDGRPWRGRVDLVSAGFPCQPVSHAGRRRGLDDERWLWPAIARVLAAVAPRLVFLENVPGLLTAGRGAAFGEVVEDLAELGLDAEWDCFSAREVGAPHRRERLFLLAFAAGDSWRLHPRSRAAGLGATDVGGPGRALGDAQGGCQSRGRLCAPGTSLAPGGPGGALDDAGREGGNQAGQLPTRLARPFPPGPGDLAAWRDVLAERPELAPALEPGVHGLADGLAGGLAGPLPAARSDQLRVLGNGVVPLVAALAFLALAERAGLLKWAR